MTIRAVDHVNIRARRDVLDVLQAFYCDVLGLVIGPRPAFPRFGYWLYAGERAVVHLYEAEPGEDRRTDAVTTLDHFAFDCTDRPEVEATLQRLGIDYRTAVIPLTGQVQLFVRDPAGNRVELNFGAPHA